MYITNQELCQKLKDLLHKKYNYVLSNQDSTYILKSDQIEFITKHVESDVQLDELLNKLGKAFLLGTPVQYILNEAVFMDLILFVDNRVLIPRPETEELVHWVYLDHKNEKFPKNVLDIGTGSGCIPIYLKRKFQSWKLFGLDISIDALDIAEMNAKKYHTDIVWIQNNFLDKNLEMHFKFDIIVSNPPYIPFSETDIMGNEVSNFEPHSALFVNDEHPFIFYESIISFSKTNLNSNGKIYCELNEFRALEINRLFMDAGYITEIRDDLQGKYRMIKAKLRN